MDILDKRLGFALKQRLGQLLWAGDNVVLIQTYNPTNRLRSQSGGLTGASLTCTAGAYVGPACRTRLIP
jgi:hypothetical protein